MPKVNTARVMRLGGQGTSPALLFSSSQWNKLTATLHQGHMENYKAELRETVLLCRCVLKQETQHLYNYLLV